MVIPGKLREEARRVSRKAKQKIARDADRKRRAMSTLDFKPGGKPAVMVGLVVVMMMVGWALIRRTDEVTQISGLVTRCPLVKAMSELKHLRVALELFKRDCGRYPTEEEGLKALVLNPGVEGWKHNYVVLVQRDPWRNNYRYTLDDDGEVVLFSYGPDGVSGTDDDLVPEEWRDLLVDYILSE